MNIQDQIDTYISTQPAAKRSDMNAIHAAIQKLMPSCKLWYLDGKNEEGKIVSNPNIGYGSYTIKYADGSSREFYQIGLSANTSGISVYVLGLADKNHLKNAYSESIGKASVSGYCIKFNKLSDIDLDVLGKAIKFGIEETGK